MTEIARLARVERPVVSTWRRRYPDFPAPAATGHSKPLFRGAEVVRWLADKSLGNASGAQIREEMALYSIAAYATQFGPRRLVEIAGSLLCLRQLVERPLLTESGTTSWSELLRRAERMDIEDEFVLRELRGADSSALTLAHLADNLVEAAYTPGNAYEWLLAARSRIGLDELAASLPTPELLRLITEVTDLPSRLRKKSRIAIADPYAEAGDLLIALIKQTDQTDGIVAFAAERVDWLARLARRRLLLAGIVEHALDVQVGTDLEEGLADPDLIVTQLPYRPGEVRSVLATLAEVERVSDLLGPGCTAVVIGPADVLVDQLTGTEEAQLRSALLRSGIVEAIVNLSGGVIPYRPGYRAALWVMTRAPIKAARGYVLLCDISAETLSERVRARLAEDILLWRAEGYRRFDGHDPRYGHAVPIAQLDAEFGGALTPPGLPQSQVLARTVTERPALIAEAEGRLDRAALLAQQYGETHGRVRGNVVRRIGSLAPLTTVGALIADGRLLKVKGHRIDPRHVQREGHHTVLGPEEVTGANPIGSRKIDRMAFAATYEYAALTEPGDILYTTSPRFALMVDHEGFSVVAFPARALRVVAEAGGPLTPRVLAALVAAARNTDRRPGAVRAIRIEDLTIPDLDPADGERLDALLTDIDVRQSLLRAQQNELAEIHNLTVAGFADGTLIITEH
ncbi:N-6 DNA methylase [Microtetraspora sp. AC03309]|uniref:N-6 DNA methylase n=1 Tax=Microtetraspora sp. AC03309 TaxID=2779376 RepID=UPI001E57E4F3|nr:N-6 DNA methylase [Microtetraspora sp. AC03309]MCC5581782.1 N-6 DNA methylase [Microtetraspora sp. AC03309]